MREGTSVKVSTCKKNVFSMDLLVKKMMIKNSFTFSELAMILALLVIATVLAVESLPGVAETRQCIDNLRRIRQAQMIYAAENNGYLALEIFQLQPLLGFKTSAIPEATGCPAVPETQKRKTFYGTEYGKNMYLFTPKKFWQGNPDEPSATRNQLNLQKTPEKTMIYMDFPPEPDGGLGAVHPGAAFLKSKDPIAFRHEGKVNVLFLDGHVETLSEIDLNNSNGFWGD